MTMNPISYSELETVVLSRNPLLFSKLQAGLPESKIRRMLNRAQVSGEIQSLIGLYKWKNGTILDPEMASSKKGFFPAPVYHFLDLEMAIADMQSFEEVAVNHPLMIEAVRRYFPVFWNGSTSWLAIDLKPSYRNRVIQIVDFDQAPEESYHSLEEFITDAIKANKEDVPLAGVRSY